jgi:hypothetical protein
VDYWRIGIVCVPVLCSVDGDWRVDATDWHWFVRSSADTDYDDGLCGECEEPPDDCVCGRDDACDTVPAVMIEPVEPIVYAQTGPWWGEPDRQD